MAPPNNVGTTTMTTSLTSSPTPSRKLYKPSRLSQENLKRTISDIAYELRKGLKDAREQLELEEAELLPVVSEAEDAKCECCGMSEDYTPEYIKCVRDKFLGKWICGLCSEAVKAENEKNGGRCEEALETHMSECVSFNEHGRAHPVQYQAEAMKEMMMNGTRARAKSMSPRDNPMRRLNLATLARSSSCLPSIMNDLAIRD